MSQFAKLFDTAAGQVLVLSDHEGEQAQLKYFIKPEGMGLCCMTAMFIPGEEGFAERDKAFAEQINQEYADGFAQHCSCRTPSRSSLPPKR